MDDMRNMLLSELIDKMHGRLADKMYPAEKPAAVETPTEEPLEDKEPVKVADDTETMSDEELDTLMKQGE